MSDLVEYTGQPNNPNLPEEPTKWRRFLDYFIPWVGKKWDRANEFADSRLEQAKIENELKKQELEKIKQEAEKLALEKEREKLKYIKEKIEVEREIQKHQQSDIIDIEAKIIEELKQELEDKIKLLRLNGGDLLKVASTKNKEPPEQVTEE